jgi:hypothetical protein
MQSGAGAADGRGGRGAHTGAARGGGSPAAAVGRSRGLSLAEPA